MRTNEVIAMVLIGGASLAHLAEAQQQRSIERTAVANGDLGDSIHEVIQVRVDFAPAAAFPRHSHPGAEVAYVLEGSLEYDVEGEPPVILNRGASLFIPAGTIHSARNVGSGRASELATYVVERGKPLVEVAP